MTAANVRHRRNHSAFGSKRERAVKKLLEAEGWVVFRCAGSKPCDLIAVRAALGIGPDPLPVWLDYGSDEPGPAARVRLIEVKGTTRSPWVAYGPAERAELRDAARRAGAVPLIAWWPPHGELQWIGEEEWPGSSVESHPVLTFPYTSPAAPPPPKPL